MRPDGGSNPGSSVYETDALPLGHRAELPSATKMSSKFSTQVFQLPSFLQVYNVFYDILSTKMKNLRPKRLVALQINLEEREHHAIFLVELFLRGKDHVTKTSRD